MNMPDRTMLGVSEIWRDNGTGTKDLYILWFRVWRWHFHHSTAWFD